MSAFFALIRKHLAEARWMLGLSILALLALGWLRSWDTANYLKDDQRQERERQFARLMGREPREVPTVLRREVEFWAFPMVQLPVLIWAIARGSLAVAGELERGTLDLVLARPLRRSTYLASHAFVGIFGLLAISGAIGFGHMIGNQVHHVPGAPSFFDFLRPTMNLAALGFSIYGFTLMLSSYDVARWRPNLIASVATILSLILLGISNLEVLARWKKTLETLSIFKRYNPVEAALVGTDLVTNLEVLGGIGLIGTVLAFAMFLNRDLPANA